MVIAIERRRRANMVERQCDVDETSDSLIIDAARVCDGWTARTRSAVDGRRITVERVEVNRVTTIQERITGGVVDL